MKQQNERIVVITGGSTGIGFATAKRFLDEGARVVVTGRDRAKLDAAVAELGERALGVPGDVARLADLDTLFATVKERFGRIDVLFANAGLARFAPPEASDEALFDLQFDTNVKGLFFTVTKALPLLREGSAIVLTGSVAGSTGMPSSTVYAATKAAVRSLGRTFAIDLAPRGIRVNTVSPGPIATPIFDSLNMPKADLDAFAAGITERLPLHRFGQPEEIANAVWFLASSEGSFVTGAELVVDGGLLQT